MLLVVTENPGGLLPTIRSRCRKLLLPPLPEEVVTDLLGRHLPDLPEADRAALARLAEGSIGRALDLASAGGLTLYRDLMVCWAPSPSSIWLRPMGWAISWRARVPIRHTMR